MKASIEVGERLQKVREHFARNPRQFAISNDFDPSVWARIEKGKAGLPDHYLKTILDTLKVDSNWLLSGRGNMLASDVTEPDTAKPAAKQRSEVVPDPQIPGIYQDIVMELIESSKAQRRASEAMHEISKALLDERQLIKDTAQAAISLATRSQQEAETSSHMLERRQEILEDCVQDLQKAVVYGFSEVLKKKPEEIETLLHSGWRGKPAGKKKQVGN